jgi:hypothetical protein
MHRRREDEWFRDQDDEEGLKIYQGNVQAVPRDAKTGISK